jgi:hypothetical protein
MGSHENTTQYATNVMAGDHIMQTIQSPYHPALNVLRRNEPVATDTIYAATPAIGTGGQKMAQLFMGRLSRVADIMGMHNEAQFINTLEDVFRICFFFLCQGSKRRKGSRKLFVNVLSKKQSHEKRSLLVISLSP